MPRYLAEQGRRLKEGYNRIVADMGMEYTRCSGFDCRTIVTFDSSAGDPLLMKSLVQQELIRRGKTIVLTTQAIYEGSDITVYHSGHVAKTEFGVLESGDMTLEATVTKLMWILGQTKEPEKIRSLFTTTIARDILMSRGQ